MKRIDLIRRLGSRLRPGSKRRKSRLVSKFEDGVLFSRYQGIERLMTPYAKHRITSRFLRD